MEERAFMGIPLEFKDICFIYPPTNLDIAKLGYNKFIYLYGILARSQEDLEDELEEIMPKLIAEGQSVPTPFQYLMVWVSQSEEIKAKAIEAFQLFTHLKPTFLYDLGAIILGDWSEKRLITEENFFDFQNMIRCAMGMKMVEPPNPNENIKIKRFKAKQRKRDRVKAKQHGSVSFITLLSAVCCVGAGVTPQNIGNLTYAAMNQLIARSQMKEAYQTDIQSLLAGADPKKVKPEYWISDIKKES